VLHQVTVRQGQLDPPIARVNHLYNLQLRKSIAVAVSMYSTVVV